MKIFNKLNKLIARASNVVGSCNSMAKQYLKIKQENPDKNEKELYGELINWLPCSDRKQKIMFEFLNNGSLNSLTFYIFYAYIINADLDDCSSDFRAEIITMIQGELKKYKLE
jgi:hypothetical protein